METGWGGLHVPHIRLRQPATRQDPAIPGEIRPPRKRGTATRRQRGALVLGYVGTWLPHLGGVQWVPTKNVIPKGIWKGNSFQLVCLSCSMLIIKF